MKKIPLLAAFILPALVFAQKDTTHVRTYYKNGKLNEHFVIDRNGVKQGEYHRNTRFGKNYIIGQYKNGEPIGVWEYYSSDTTGTLVQRLDFDNHKELFVDPLKVHTLICGPRYFGGNMLEQEYIQRHIKSDFSDAERAICEGQSYTVSFTVDSSNYRTILVGVNDGQSVPPQVKEKMEKIVSEMPAWLPPVCKEEEVWRFSVTFVFQ